MYSNDSVFITLECVCVCVCVCLRERERGVSLKLVFATLMEMGNPQFSLLAYFFFFQVKIPPYY